LKQEARAGVKTKELDRIASDTIKAGGATAAFLGYRGFPGSICACVNEEVVHGIPGEKALKDGDLLSIDVGTKKAGYFSDAAVTFEIGKIGSKAAQLVKVAREALYKAIDAATIGNRVSDISFAIQDYVEGHGLSVIREFVGHGIGTELHEDPPIPNYGQKGMGPAIKEGMIFAIETMISAGGWQVEVLDDGWTAVTKDRSLTAHFEHTIAVTESRPVILTDGIM